MTLSVNEIRISSYIFQIIVDEIDPVDDEWVPYHPVGSNPILLNELGESNGDGRPTILMRSAPELPVVAWSRNSPTGFDIVISRFDGQAWTVPPASTAASARTSAWATCQQALSTNEGGGTRPGTLPRRKWRRPWSKTLMTTGGARSSIRRAINSWLAVG